MSRPPAASAPQLIDQAGRPITRQDVARVRVRASLDVGNRWGAYDGAAIGTADMAGWTPNLRSPDSALSPERDRMVARMRDLVRNDGWAGGLITRLCDTVVGPNFAPIPKPNWRALARGSNAAFDLKWSAEFTAAVRAEWKRFADDTGRYCDAERTQTVGQQLRTAFRSKLIDGDSLVATGWRDVRPAAAPYATTFRLLASDRLHNPNGRPDMLDCRGGVQLDGDGAPIGYWLRQAAPGDWYASAGAEQYDLFARETDWGRPLVVHDFDREAADQHRGVGLLAAVLPRFRMLAKFDQASLQAALLRTLVGFFVRSPYDAEQIKEAMDSNGGDDLGWYQTLRDAHHDANRLDMGGVRMPTLAPGEEIQSVTGGDHATDFRQFQNAFLGCVGASAGTSREEITRDFSDTNYSSYRGASAIAWATARRRRRDFAVNTCAPLFSAWLEEFLDGDGASLLPAGAPDFLTHRGAYSHADWIGPGRDWIDPVKEREGEEIGLRNGFGTLASTIGETSGRYWLDVIEEGAAEREVLKQHGITPDYLQQKSPARSAPVPAPEGAAA